MLNADKVVKKTKKEEAPEIKEVKEQPKTSDHISVKEKIAEYSLNRMAGGRISETHTRSTFLIDDETLEKLQNLTDYIEGINGLETEFNEDRTARQIRDERLFSKGIKSKLINYALDTLLEQYEKDEGIIPKVQKARFKHTDGTFHRAFKFTENGVTYYLEQNNRGKEIRFLSTDKDISEQEIEELFNEKVELENY
ncbi:hypothetical protein KJB58_10875 [Staphylococcus hyicus]|uniref:Uncharacterized protein n=1 Tax=Staphylococcus hyicus TaxID=1284 RepID=A0A418JGU9_STAHY|nr:hypothetical protein [Staphylococcus hyicus]MCE5154964.1 hypothetical protein [Staphylococcus hyicus]RIO43496.1 hypothetical protein BUZ57_10810 [Staphylococcus hyicus]